LGKHSNEKPAEPEKKVPEIEIEIPTPVERKPIDTLERVPFETPCTQLEPTVNPSFKKQMDSLDLTPKKPAVSADGSVTVGTSCKRGGCTCSYESPATNDSVCVFHPGVPVFHEGYKFWSCCKKKTSDFSSFLSQVGCESGKHKWENDGEHAKVACRWDWHQTASNVVVAVYAKNYDYKRSFVKVNPIRLVVKLIFPKEDDSEFYIDLELRGVIDVSKASATMFGTKVEITLPKAEGGHWMKLDFPRETVGECETQDPVTNGVKEHKQEAPKVEQKKEATPIEDDESDVDLDDLELVQGATITELGELARSCQLVEES
jgi:cysteine and histidine-rich domain-containing protein